MKTLRNILLSLSGLILLAAILLAAWVTWFFDLNLKSSVDRFVYPASDRMGEDYVQI